MAFTQTIQHATRRLLRVPGFTLTAALTLALGVGATTAVFSIINSVLLRPLPYDRSDELVFLAHTVSLSGLTGIDQSDATYLHYRQGNVVFTDTAAYRVASVNLGGAGQGGSGASTEAERITAGRVTASTFPVLRASALRGRVFVEEEDRPGAPALVVIAERLWIRKYGEDPGIVGRVVSVDGVAHEIVGVMPASFRFPSAETELWLPLKLDPNRTESATFDYQAIGRLRPGVSLEAAAADLQRVLPRLPEAFPGRMTLNSIQQMKMRATVRPLKDVIVGDIGRVLWVVLGAVIFLLAITCSNVANLFLVRAEGRQRELAVRRALGAGRGALVLEFISEGLVLAGFGAVAGVALAAVALNLFRTGGASIDIPRMAEVGIDGVVLTVAIVAAIGAALFVSALPALRSGRGNLTEGLTDSSRGSTAGRARHRARNALVVSQVALALVLLAGSGLMARSFARLRSVQPGFDAAGVLTFHVALPEAAYRAPADGARFLSRALDDFAQIPGVQSTGVTSKLPLDAEGKRDDTGLFVEDRPFIPGSMPNIHQVVYVSPDYFRAMGIPIMTGRTFDPIDPERVPSEAIVSQAFANRYWPGQQAIGKRIRILINGPWHTIVGVVGSVRGTALERPSDDNLYYPLVPSPVDRRWAPRDMTFVIRTAGDPATVSTPARDIMRRLDAALPIYRVREMADVLAEAAARTSLTLLLLGVASVVALIVGAIGIYGVLSYVVSLRTREIGLRLALGAQPPEVRWMVSRHGIGVAAIGIAVGLGAALVVTRVLATLLYDISPTDATALGAAALILLVVAAAASWVPARRASRVDPARALRAE